jgi:hypothetical protein
LAQRTAAQWVLEADIKACFDRISHEWLLTHIPLPRPVLKQWLKSGYMSTIRRRLYHHREESRYPGTRRPATGRAVPGTAGATTLNRENADQPYRARLQLPGIPLQEVPGDLAGPATGR